LTITFSSAATDLIDKPWVKVCNSPVAVVCPPTVVFKVTISPSALETLPSTPPKEVVNPAIYPVC
jgi:hypothetical protein